MRTCSLSCVTRVNAASRRSSSGGVKCVVLFAKSSCIFRGVCWGEKGQNVYFGTEELDKARIKTAAHLPSPNQTRRENPPNQTCRANHSSTPSPHAVKFQRL